MADNKRPTLSLPARDPSATPAGERRRPPLRGSSKPRPPARPRFGAEGNGESRSFDGDRRPRRDDERPAFRRDGERPAPRRDGERRPGERDERRSFGDRPARPSFREGDAPRERRNFEGERRPRREDERPTFRRDGERPAPRRDGDRDERRSFGDRPRPSFREGDAPRERRNFEGERRPRRSESAPRAPRVLAPEEFANAPVEHDDKPGALRLSKRMSELGLCSRREADEYIERGWVRVDGEVVCELGAKVTPEQRIELDVIAEEMQMRRVTILINKPIGYVSGQAEDGYEPASVLITPENHWSEDPTHRRFESRVLRKLAPAGRLDIDSTGLLVLTQDGRIAKRLIGEYSDVEKEYLVRVEGRIRPDGLKLLNHGLELDGVELLPAKVSWQNEDQLRFVLQEGRKRQIRRMCELVGLKVVGLKRIRIGRIPLSKLPLGQWRYLGEHEEF